MALPFPPNPTPKTVSTARHLRCTFGSGKPMAGSSRWLFRVALAVIFAIATACQSGASGPPSATARQAETTSEQLGPHTPSAVGQSFVTCAPNGQPWASRACDESRWLRHVISAVRGQIAGLADGIEPQRRDAFLVLLDGKTFSLGAISRRVFKANGAYWSMGEFSAGMADAGSVEGLSLFGNHRMGHWSWEVHHFIVQVYPDPANDSALSDLIGRPMASRLLRATLSTEP